MLLFVDVINLSLELGLVLAQNCRTFSMDRQLFELFHIPDLDKHQHLKRTAPYLEPLILERFLATDPFETVLLQHHRDQVLGSQPVLGLGSLRIREVRFGRGDVQAGLLLVLGDEGVLAGQALIQHHPDLPNINILTKYQSQELC